MIDIIESLALFLSLLHISEQVQGLELDSLVYNWDLELVPDVE
jgi:hypothetical protein